MSADRKCVICGATDRHRLSQETWEVAGLGPIDIGMVICTACGFVYQHPVVPPEKMAACYTQMSNYTNPSRAGKPTDTKIAIVDSQTRFIRDRVGASGRALQIGCSDGYTLSRFRAEGWQVKGVEPSGKAAQLAREMYGVDCAAEFFEAYTPQADERYDLIIMTHVLEHIYEPGQTLQKCHALLNPGGHVYIEVPSLVEPERWSSSYFSFEHVNYFAPVTMTNLLLRHGFTPVEPPVTVEYKANNPALRCLARRADTVGHAVLTSDFTRAESICRSFLERNRATWAAAEQRVRDGASDVNRLVIWGAGIHTSQLLCRTRLAEIRPIEFIADMDPQKQGLRLGRYPIRSTNEIPFGDPTLAIVISSYASEKEILKSIQARPNVQAKVIPLYT
ncbi:MAG: Ubiquinone biosynthesis O-methyltransferase [Verrucomicrobiae bacterium]|nr:Ubiquinone biosynthesis O-methyltransferase [Verrucomicrobiae bacterium]